MLSYLIPVLFFLISFLGCAQLAPAAVNNAKPLKVGFITVGPVTDWGYNYAHDQGRKFIEQAMPGEVETTIIEKIPENSDVERVMEKIIAHGTKLIFATSYGYLEPTMRVAARHPDVIFESTGRYITNGTKNIGTYFARQYQPMYVCGLVAGRMTRANSLGFIAAHPITQVLQNINAFTLGARSVNPNIKVHVVWTNSWSDPPTEAEAAKGLIESGVDVLTMHLDSPFTVVQTAEKYGTMVVGYHASLRPFAPKEWLTGEMWNWGPLYVKIVRSVIEGTWKAGNLRYDMKDGYTKLSPFGNIVPYKVRREALAVAKKIEEKKLIVFQGPLKDREGKEQIPAGGPPSYELIESMNWLVPGVEGALPKG
jgi:basic membrane protein A and related proteins